MATPWWIPLLAGGIGVFGGLAGGWMTHLFTSKRDAAQENRLVARQDAEWRRQREDKLRELRGQLYVDLMEHLENSFRNLADAFSDDEDAPRPDLIPDVVHESRLNARIELYADEDVRRGWHELGVSAEAIRRAFTAEKGLDHIYQAIQSAQKNVRELRQTLREQVIRG